jgi:hypothetical protein
MKKSELKNIIRESINNLINEQNAIDSCSKKICAPCPPALVNQHWRDCFSVPGNGLQNANFADYKFEHPFMGDCPGDTPGTSWRWFDGITLSQYEGPNPIHPNWASMVNHLQNQGVDVTLDMTGQQVATSTYETLGVGIIANPQGQCGPPCPGACDGSNNGEKDICQDPNWLALPLGGEAGEPNYIGSKNNYCDRCSTNNQGPDFPVSWINGQFQYDPQNGINYCECCESMGKKPELQRLKKPELQRLKKPELQRLKKLAGIRRR